MQQDLDWRNWVLNGLFLQNGQVPGNTPAVDSRRMQADVRGGELEVAGGLPDHCSQLCEMF